MKRWRLEVRAKDGKISTGSVEATDPSTAMAKAAEKGFEVVKILGWEDLPLSPEPAATPRQTAGTIRGMKAKFTLKVVLWSVVGLFLLFITVAVIEPWSERSLPSQQAPEEFPYRIYVNRGPNGCAVICRFNSAGVPKETMVHLIVRDPHLGVALGSSSKRLKDLSVASNGLVEIDVGLWGFDCDSVEPSWATLEFDP